MDIKVSPILMRSTDQVLTGDVFRGEIQLSQGAEVLFRTTSYSEQGTKTDNIAPPPKNCLQIIGPWNNCCRGFRLSRILVDTKDGRIVSRHDSSAHQAIRNFVHYPMRTYVHWALMERVAASTSNGAAPARR